MKDDEAVIQISIKPQFPNSFVILPLILAKTQSSPWLLP
jgi:hypothetical protein